MNRKVIRYYKNEKKKFNQEKNTIEIRNIVEYAVGGGLF